MQDFHVKRLGLVMEPQPGNHLEVEGVLNPAAIRGRDGQLYLFPRIVADGNYSRIGIARVRFSDAGDPVGVERLGVALEPEAEYEKGPDGAGGCEDPRVTFVEELQRYVMSYTALSSRGPRIAFAISADLFRWERLGLATFLPYDGIAFEDVDNKDACAFPVAIPDTRGRPSLAVMHRPLFPGSLPDEAVQRPKPHHVDLRRESIWISYCSFLQLCHFTSHHRLAAPTLPWEQLKIGLGAPPVMCRHGWLVIYHGVSEQEGSDAATRRLRYAAGVMVLSAEHPRTILYRSAAPILAPELPNERTGNGAEIIFPTGIDRRDDLGMPDRFDIYYGMADRRIGVARLDMPPFLPPSAGPANASAR